MGKRIAIFAFAIALAGGAMIAGCGGGDDDADPKQEYLQTGDEICALGTFQIGNEAQQRYKTPQPPPKEQNEFTEEVVVPVLRTQVLEKLRALTPPEGDAQRVSAIWAALERGIDALQANPELLGEPNTGGAFEEASRLAQAYGFQQCGSG
jgi:hypothetical protein